ncbi:MAG: hypothetical protein WD995_02105 [Gemmatimonadota bacterium]
MMKRRPGALVALLTVAITTACTTWQPVAAGPRVVIPEQRPSSVRLTLIDGTVATVRSPLLRNDSIVSSEIGRAGVATTDVGAMEVQRVSVGKTVGLVAAGAVAAALWTSVLAGASSGNEGETDPLPKGFAPSVVTGLVWLARLIR